MDKNKMDQKVSVIIPVYNDEKYLVECVDSVLNQTYRNLEVILVNDGSTDQSAQICEQLHQKDKRIRVLHKQNGGVGDSRNAGLAMADGELLAFVDNDDLMEPNNLEKLIDLMKRHDADVAIGNFYEYLEDKHLFLNFVNKDSYFEKVYTPAELFMKAYKHEYNFSQCFTVPWGKVYKRELFETIAYPTDESADDDFTTWQVYLLADRIAFMNAPLIMYRQHSATITGNSNQAKLYSIAAVEQRIAIMSLLGMDISEELKAYRWRLQVHQRELLKSGSQNLVKYKNVLQRLKIIEKYANQPKSK